MEPDWEQVERELLWLTVAKLREIARDSNIPLGGESTKGALAREMVSQLRHWWKFGSADAQAKAHAALGELGVEVKHMETKEMAS